MRTSRTAAALAAVVVACAGCAHVASRHPAVAGPAGRTAARTILTDVCPKRIVVQTDWFAEAEHGGLYQLLAPGATVDAESAAVRAPLIAGGHQTGVELEIREGGPARRFAKVSDLLYAEQDAPLLGYVSTDEAVQFSATHPTVSILAPLEKNPQMIMWDPATYPTVATIAQLGAAGARVHYLPGATYMGYLVGAGILGADHVDSAYDGNPGAFVAAGGRIAQQGYGSSEPYDYANEVAGWYKPVTYQYLDDAGYPVYAQTIATRPENLERWHACFERLVPIMQQAEVDYLRQPDATNRLIVATVVAMNNGWHYSAGNASYAVATMAHDALVSNGTNATLGDMDAARVQRVIEITRPLFTKAGVNVRADLRSSDLMTNRFIDPAIGL